MKRKSRRKSEKVSKMGGSECKATVLKHMIKKLNKITILQNNYDLLTVVEKATASHSSTLAWKISWTEEPGRLQSMGSLRVRHD